MIGVIRSRMLRDFRMSRMVHNVLRMVRVMGWAVVGVWGKWEWGEFRPFDRSRITRHVDSVAFRIFDPHEEAFQIIQNQRRSTSMYLTCIRRRSHSFDVHSNAFDNWMNFS